MALCCAAAREVVLEGVGVLLEHEAAEGESVVRVGPFPLDVDGLHELFLRVLVLRELLVSAGQVEDARLVVAVQLEGLLVALERSGYVHL